MESTIKPRITIDVPRNVTKAEAVHRLIPLVAQWFPVDADNVTDYIKPSGFSTVTDTHRNRNRHIADFIEQHCNVAPELCVPVIALWNCYEAYVSARFGHGSHITRKMFTRAVILQTYATHGGASRSKLWGIALKAEPTAEV